MQRSVLLWQRVWGSASAQRFARNDNAEFLSRALSTSARAAAAQEGCASSPASSAQPRANAFAGVVHVVPMPKLSHTMEQGQLVTWLKKQGEYVSMYDVLFQVSCPACGLAWPSWTLLHDELLTRGACIYASTHATVHPCMPCRPCTLPPAQQDAAHGLWHCIRAVPTWQHTLKTCVAIRS